MSILLKNASFLSEYGIENGKGCVIVEGNTFSYVGSKIPAGKFDRVIDCDGNLLMPGLYNTHCHAAMTLFRGYGDDLPLDRWLNERIFPAEDNLTSDGVYWATLAATAEMIGGGVVSFSDMYMFEDSVARAVIDSGMKGNLARSIVSFDENIDMNNDFRFLESASFCNEYNDAGNGRIITDMSLHAEYTNVPRACEFVANYCAKKGLRVQIHLSETQKEHLECIERRGGKTPTEFFESLGIFDVPATAAHCVWVSDSDIEILARKNVYVAHNPTSNLKLASGIMPYKKMNDAGICISLGTDGAGSNNSLNIMKEIQLASLLHKGVERDAEIATASEILKCATINGALAQGRQNCGKIAKGYRADAILIDTNTLNNRPCFDMASTAVYSAERSNVKMTMCDGRILYENGEYKSIDTERVKYELNRAVSYIIDRTAGV